MKAWLQRSTFVLSLAALAACSEDAKKKATPCSRDELECGQSCSNDRPCPTGLFCDSGACTAECTPESVEQDCGAPAQCSTAGQCLSDDAGAGSSSMDASSGQEADVGPPAACGEVSLEPTPKTPNVLLVIDQSASMDDPFGDSTRWEALKTSLLAENGLIATLEDVVRFGVVLYSSDDGGPTCPLLTPAEVTVALNNLDDIRAVYEDADTKRDTPTGDAIQASLAQVQESGLLEGDDPTIFVLATDGEPDTCAEPNPQNGQAESIAAIEAAYEAGVRTYVIAVADEDELSEEHVQDIANAGVGMDDAPSYRVDGDAALRDALRSIVAGEISCVVPLKGKVTAEDRCVGKVELNGGELKCGDSDGYRLVDESSLEVQGDACDKLKLGGTLSARFPCGSVIVL